MKILKKVIKKIVLIENKTKKRIETETPSLHIRKLKLRIQIFIYWLLFHIKIKI